MGGTNIFMKLTLFKLIKFVIELSTEDYVHPGSRCQIKVQKVNHSELCYLVKNYNFWEHREKLLSFSLSSMVTITMAAMVTM